MQNSKVSAIDGINGRDRLGDDPSYPAPRSGITYPFRQAVMVRTGGGGERPQCAEIRHLRTPNSAVGWTMLRADGTITV